MKIKCNYCNKEIEKDEYHIKRAKHNFCSIKCKALFQQKQNTIIIKKDYAILKIKNIEVLIDIEDIEKINKYKWITKFDKKINSYYVNAWERNKKENNRKRIILHRYLTNCPQNLQVDHINRNTLDNRKTNLKICTLLENLQNKGFYKNNKTGFKYISYHKKKKTYICEIKKNKKIIFRKSCKNLEKLVNYRNVFLKGGDIICQ